MITRHPAGRPVTYYGEEPITDHDGYAVEVAGEEGTEWCRLRIATAVGSRVRISAELNESDVRETIARLAAWLEDHQEQK